MLPVDRRKKIEDILVGQGSVVVSKLSGMLGVSEETIRRDLDYLSQSLDFRRVHGGAYLIDTRDKEVPVAIRESIFLDEKMRIGETSVELLSSGDTIMLDSSTTAAYVARALKKSGRQVCVITNSVRVIDALSGSHKIDIIGLGGQFRSVTGSFVGSITVEGLNSLSADKAFISCTAVHSEFALTDNHQEESVIRRLMVKRSIHPILIADHTKFDKLATYKVCDLHEINTVITDRFPNKKIRKEIESSGTKTLVCD